MAKILVVDDSKSVHAFIRDCFLGSSHILVHVYDGTQALESFDSGENYDLILLDWEMPKLTGPETFDAIKKRAVTTPVVMMTTRNSMEDISKMIQAGVSEYIMKPFTKDILSEKFTYVTGLVIKDAA